MAPLSSPPWRSRSLRGRLVVLWVISLVSAVAVGALLVQLYRQSAIDQVARADALSSRACDEIADRYQFYAAGMTAPPADLPQGLTAVIVTALARRTEIAGGIWQYDSGSLAYAFPTDDGGNRKADVPAAELDAIRAINAEAWAEDRSVTSRQAGRFQTLLLHACPLPGPIDGLTAWTMTRVFTGQGAGYSRLLGGLAVLFASVLASAAWTTHLLLTWSRKLAAIETGVAQPDGLDPPLLALTGERELDRIVAGLNATTAKLRGARAEAERLSVQVAAADRLAALGRVAAGIAHEIRNPIAAMRLKAENALQADDARRRAALETILGQIARLDSLLRDLLTLTHRSEPSLRATDVGALLEACAAFHREVAERHGVALATEHQPQKPSPSGRGRGEGRYPETAAAVLNPHPGPLPEGEGDLNAITWPLDPDRVRRALDNLVLNAIQNVPPDSHVTLSAAADGATLRIQVQDDGPGLPASVRDHLFEPFVTTRPDGTGLGLSIVKEMVVAHGGVVEYRPGNPGSLFQLVLPLREG